MKRLSACQLIQRLGLKGHPPLQHRQQPGPLALHFGINVLDVGAGRAGAVHRSTAPAQQAAEPKGGDSPGHNDE